MLCPENYKKKTAIKITVIQKTSAATINEGDTVCRTGSNKTTSNNDN